MRRRITRSANLIGILLFLAFFTGCDQASLMKRWTSPEGESTAKNFIDSLRQKKFAEAENNLFPGLQGADTHDTLVGMAAMFPEQEPQSTKVVGFQTFRDANSTTSSITLEYQFPQKWLLANVVITERDGVASIAGFHVTPISNSLEDLNRFTLSGKSPLQYVVLLLAILSALFSFYALALCVRTKIEKRKWLWLILTLLGLGKFGIDWTSGKTIYTDFAIQLPPAGAVLPLYSAWMFYFSLPVGAVLFLSLRKRLSASVSRPDQ
jgi:hypothetical protein